MFNEEEFRKTLIKNGLTLRDVAKAMDISMVTLYRKMSGESDFFRREIQTFCLLTSCDSPDSIFFAHIVA